MLNILVVLLFILTLPIWLVLLAIISPILVPIALGVVLWVIGREVRDLGRNMTNYEKSVAAFREGNAEYEATNTILNPTPKPQGTPDKISQTKGYTVEMYLQEKPAVYRIVDPNMVDLGMSYNSLAEALHEIGSYVGDGFVG